MAGQSSFSSTSLSVTGFDANTTGLGSFANAAAFTASGLDEFVLAAPLTHNVYNVWNWAATTDSNFDAGTGTAAANPISNPPSNNQIVGQIGTDNWSMTINFTQYGNAATAGDVVAESGVTILTSNGTTNQDGAQVQTTVTGSGANSLAAFFRNLSVDMLGTRAGGQFGISFNIADTTTSTSIPVFTEAFGGANSACYAAGTRVATPSGEIAIETLEIGDLVATSSGIAKPVKWVGRRTYTAAQVAANPHLRPVVIRKNALANAMPHRDLAVSAMHALFLDDVFIPAASLENGITILRSDALEPVEYIHIELDDHDVIFAEGAPAETFVDDNSRLMFDNADEYFDIYGADEAARGFSAPRIEEGYQLEAVRSRLAVRAGASAPVAAEPALRGHIESVSNGAVHGWVMDAANQGRPVELDILVEGETIARVLANRYRADLDHAGLVGGRCAFSVALPASVTSLEQVEVRHTADGSALAKPLVAALAD